MSTAERPLKIAYLAAGAGGMICGSCIRDNALARSLKALGHDALLLPIYTPLRTDESNVSETKVFYGAINIYLEQLLPLWGRAPGWLRHRLDYPPLLRRVTRSATSTDAKGLGELALSMIQGEVGRQKAELEDLVSWLRDEYRPDVVHLTNSMLVGMARRLRDELPEALVVAGLQGEDIFLADLVEPHHDRVLEELRSRARDVDLLLATSNYYRAAMIDLLDLPEDRVDVATLGIQLEGHRLRPEPPAKPLTFGFLARICPEKGFHVAVDAFKQLADRLGPDVRFRAAGYLGGRDQRYFEEQRARIDGWGLSSQFDWLGEVDRREKIDMLHSLHVFVMPTVYQEAKGLPALEAMINGVPVVLPDHGTFPEILEQTGGGVLHRPGDASDLADVVERLLASPEERARLGHRGHRGVQDFFGAENMARSTVAAYRRALARRDGETTIEAPGAGQDILTAEGSTV